MMTTWAGGAATRAFPGELTAAPSTAQRTCSLPVPSREIIEVGRQGLGGCPGCCLPPWGLALLSTILTVPRLPPPATGPHGNAEQGPRRKAGQGVTRELRE